MSLAEELPYEGIIKFTDWEEPLISERGNSIPEVLATMLQEVSEEMKVHKPNQGPICPCLFCVEVRRDLGL